MIAECKKCETKIEVESPSTKWHPPLSIESIGSIECPNCSNRADLQDYILHTNSNISTTD